MCGLYAGSAGNKIIKRLTEKHYGANDYYMTCSEECERDNCVECAAFEKIVDRLGTYEDTGLTPEDCAEYRKFEDEIIASGKTFGRLIELLNADKEGCVVVLPCKVGDTVIDQTFEEAPTLMRNIRVEIAYERRWGNVFHIGYDMFADLVENGRIKPASEEAEEALEAMKND